MSCNNSKTSKTEEEVPTTLEQHSSSVSSSSSSSDTGVGSASTSSSSSSSSSSGAPTSFSFSTSGKDTDVSDLTNIRDIADNKEVRDYLQKEAIKLMLADRLIESEDASVSLAITNEWVMVNKQILNEKDSEKYVELLKSKLSMGSVFNYSFRQN
ncbi:MAG: hypothetical protein HEP71_20025 [Roseivirga sp.]|nr:hypothetical protein [Roseivirga sp.]